MQEAWRCVGSRGGEGQPVDGRGGHVALCGARGEGLSIRSEGLGTNARGFAVYREARG